MNSYFPKGVPQKCGNRKTGEETGLRTLADQQVSRYSHQAYFLLSFDIRPMPLAAPVTRDTLFLSAYSNLRPFLDYCDEHNINWREIARQCDIPDEALEGVNWLPTRSTLSFLSTLFSSTTEPIGIYAGQKLELAHFPELENALEGINTLEEAIDTFMRVSVTSLSSHVYLWTEHIAGQWMICHREPLPASMPGFHQIEWFRTLGIITLCRRYLGQRWLPDTLLMRTPKHLSSIKPVALEQANISFGQSFGAFSVPLATDYRPLQSQPGEMEWFDRVHALINTYATLPGFSVSWLARLTGLSNRTLQRRLQEQGTSLSLLRDDARFRKAKQLLSETDVPAADIAGFCGYSDLSNFNRAFRAWSGMSAPHYRSTAPQYQ